jgi:hypothetical protein
MAVLPGVVQVVMGIVPSRIVADPDIAFGVDVGRFGMALGVAKGPAILGRWTRLLLRSARLLLGSPGLFLWSAGLFLRSAGLLPGGRTLRSSIWMRCRAVGRDMPAAYAASAASLVLRGGWKRDER